MSQASLSDPLRYEPLRFERKDAGIPVDNVLRIVTAGSAVTIVVMLAALVLVLFNAATLSIHTFGLSFLTGSDWRPNELSVPQRGADGKILYDENGDMQTTVLPPEFGALPVIWGTTVSSLLALLFAVPLSMAAALFLIRVAPGWLARPVSFLVEFLAAIPSIAYGIWALFVLSPLLQRTIEVRLNGFFLATPGLHWLALPAGGVTGRDMLAGGLVLGVMIVPIITAIARDVLRQVPRAQIEGTVALGATWWESSKEMLKFSRSGLFGAVMLGLARAAGETMAITMVIGNNNQIRASLLAPAQTMSSLLANEFAEANSDLHRSALAEVALILLLMSLAFNVIARYLVVGKGLRTAAGALTEIWMKPHHHNFLARLKSQMMFTVCVLCTLLILSLLVWVIGYLLVIGAASVNWGFFTQGPIPIGMPGSPGGMQNALVGTIILIAVASLIGIPIGMLAGVYLAEYESGSWLATPVRFVADVLAGVPSIVVGILGYELLVRPLHNYNGWAGAAALGFIMVPIITRTTEEMLRLVPGSYREASIALGATKARTILRVVIPSAMGSIVTGIMLAIARVAGETAPLLFTALGSRITPAYVNGHFPFVHVDMGKPFPSLTVQIFNYAQGPDIMQRHEAWAGILVLVLLIFLLNLAIRLSMRGRQAA